MTHRTARARSIRARSIRTWSIGALASAGLAALPGCEQPGVLGQRTGRDIAPGWRAPGPFEPVALRIYPLTRLERDDRGKPQLVLHTELKDEWGDTVKGVGALTVQLLRPQGTPADDARAEVRWDVPLWSAEDNARHYDPSSRTYRIVLGNVPDWATQGPVRLTAQLETPRTDGTMRRLWDELELQP